MSRVLPGRLKAGQEPLELRIGVRIPAREPFYKNKKKTKIPAILEPMISTIMFSILIISIVMYLILGIVIDFHWRSYAGNSASLMLTRITYAVVGVVLLALMLLQYMTYAPL